MYTLSHTRTHMYVYTQTHTCTGRAGIWNFRVKQISWWRGTKARPAEDLPSHRHTRTHKCVYTHTHTHLCIGGAGMVRVKRISWFIIKKERPVEYNIYHANTNTNICIYACTHTCGRSRNFRVKRISWRRDVRPKICWIHSTPSLSHTRTRIYVYTRTHICTGGAGIFE